MFLNIGQHNTLMLLICGKEDVTESIIDFDLFPKASGEARNPA